MIHPTHLRKRPPRALPSSLPATLVCRRTDRLLHRARRQRTSAGLRLLRGSPWVTISGEIRLKRSGFGRQFVGKHLGAIIPPIGERAIAFTCIVPGRFKATVDTTEHNGFG